MKDTLTFLTISFFVLIFANACNKDEDFVPKCDGSTPTYDAGIMTIINNNCTSAPCHASGSANGDWTNFAGLNTVINNGEFETSSSKHCDNTSDRNNA